MTGVTVPAPPRAGGGAATKPARRSALLFIGGLAQIDVDQSVEGIARRVAAAMDRRATTGSARFSVRLVRQQAGLNVGCATITRSGDDHAVDIWMLPTEKDLTCRYASASPIKRALLGGLVVARYLPRIGHEFGDGCAKSREERSQLMIARLGMALMVAYLVALVVTVAASFANASWMPHWVSGALLAITGLGLWKANVVRQMSTAAMQAHCLVQYLDHGYRADVFRGRVAALLEQRRRERGRGVRPNRRRRLLVRVAGRARRAVSGGHRARAALRRDRQPRDDRLSVRPRSHLLAGLLRRPATAPRKPARWVNVYSPLDILGSNFRDARDGKIGVELLGGGTVRPENERWAIPGHADDDVSVIEILMLVGLKAHAMYWGFEDEGEDTAFGPVVEKLYRGKPLLA